MHQKGFVNIILIGAVVLVLAIGGYLLLVRKSPPAPTQEPYSTPISSPESEVIVNSTGDWAKIESSIPFRPTHPGTSKWNNPDAVQFIGKSTLIVRFEDGYNAGMAVLRFNSGEFTILESFQNQADFTLSDWQNLIKKYGDNPYSVSTYTTSLVRNKEIVSFPKLMKVPENVFVKGY